MEDGERIRHRFLLGIVVLAPLVITVWAVITLTNFIAGWLARILSHLYLLKPLPYPLLLALSVILVFLGVYFVGFIATTYAGRIVFEIMDWVMLNIPFLNYIYRVSKETIRAFYDLPTKKVFKEVVWVKVGDNMKMLGFVTVYEDDKAVIFVPSTPNPTTGFTIWVDKDFLEKANISVEDALKIIISGGIVNVFQKG